MVEQKPCAEDLFCGVNRPKDPANPTDLEKKHLPVIESPDSVQLGECFTVTVEVGNLLAHPNENAHFIEFVELYADDTYLGRADFTAKTARLTDSAGFSRAVSTLVSQTFQVLSVTIWLVDATRGRFMLGGSTALQETQTTDPSPGGEDVHDLIEALTRQTQPVDIDVSREPWVESLKQLNPDSFRKGGNRICTSLIAGDELVGLMVMGDRVSGMPYTQEEPDLTGPRETLFLPERRLRT